MMVWYPSGLDQSTLAITSLKYWTETRIEILDAAYNFKPCDLCSHKTSARWSLKLSIFLAHNWTVAQTRLYDNCFNAWMRSNVI